MELLISPSYAPCGSLYLMFGYVSEVQVWTETSHHTGYRQTYTSCIWCSLIHIELLGPIILQGFCWWIQQLKISCIADGSKNTRTWDSIKFSYALQHVFWLVVVSHSPAVSQLWMSFFQWCALHTVFVICTNWSYPVTVLAFAIETQPQLAHCCFSPALTYYSIAERFCSEVWHFVRGSGGDNILPWTLQDVSQAVANTCCMWQVLVMFVNVVSKGQVQPLVHWWKCKYWGAFLAMRPFIR